MKGSLKKILAFTMSVILVLTAGFTSVYAAEADENESYYEQVVNYQSLIADDEEDCLLKDPSDIADSKYSTQDSSSYTYLKNYLINYGTYSSSGHSYYISKLTNTSSSVFYASITYDLDDYSVSCSSILESSSGSALYVNMKLGSSESSYSLSAVADYTSIGISMIYGSATVYPSSYYSSSNVSFRLFDYYGYTVSDSSLASLLSTMFDTSLDYWNSLLTSKVGLTLGNFGFTRLYSRKEVPGTTVTYKITYDANGGTGAPATQQKKSGESVKLSTAYPTREGYTFAGWATTKTATTATYQPGDTYSSNANITLYAVWVKNVVDEPVDPDEPTVDPDEPTVDPDDPTVDPDEPNEDPVVYPDVYIVNNPGTTTQSYGVQLVLEAKATNLPYGAKIVWYLDGQRTNVTGEDAYLECLTDCLVSVKIVDEYGNVMVDENGKEISDSEKVYVKDGFFQRLIAFFRNLFFGATVVYQ